MKLFVRAVKELSSYMNVRNNISNTKNVNPTYFIARIVNIKFVLMPYETSLGITNGENLLHCPWSIKGDLLSQLV